MFLEINIRSRAGTTFWTADFENATAPKPQQKIPSYIHLLDANTLISIHIKTCPSGIPGIFDFGSLRLHIAKPVSIQTATNSWCVLKLNGGYCLSARTSLARSLNSVFSTKVRK